MSWEPSDKSDESLCLSSSVVLLRENVIERLASSLLHLYDKLQNDVNCISGKICYFAGCSVNRAPVCIKMCELGQHCDGTWEHSNIVMPNIKGRFNGCVGVFVAQRELNGALNVGGTFHTRNVAFSDVIGKQ